MTSEGFECIRAHGPLTDTDRRAIEAFRMILRESKEYGGIAQAMGDEAFARRWSDYIAGRTDWPADAD